MSTNEHSYHNFEAHSLNSGLDVELAHAHVRRGGKGCFCACCLGCFGFLLLIALINFAFWYCFFRGGASLTVSPETTIITEPLKSDGKTVDFHQAIQKLIEPNIPANENGFRDVFVGYGKQIFEADDHLGKTDWQYSKTCEHFGIDPLTPPLYSLKNPLNQQIVLDQEGLDSVQIAAAKPHYFVPLVRENEKTFALMSQPYAAYAFHQTLSDALRQRADRRFRTKEIGGAWKDVLASLRLYRRVTVNQAWLQALGGNDDESFLAPVARVVDTLPQWTPVQLEQAITDLDSLPDWQDRQTTLMMVQFTLLDMLSAADDLAELDYRLGLDLPKELREILPVLQLIGFDWNVAAKELNSEIKNYAKRVEKMEGTHPEAQVAELDLRDTEESFEFPWNEAKWEEMIEENPLLFFSAPGRSKLAGLLAGELVMKAVGEMYRQQMMEESRCQILRLALALEQFHREHQEYPDSLKEISLRTMTQNMFLEYEKTAAGYRLSNEFFSLE